MVGQNGESYLCLCRTLENLGIVDILEDTER
jgi:hypothetical protein